MSLGEIPGGNLRAYYKLEGLTDSSGNGFDLTNNNTVTFGAGKFANAADFGSSGTNKGLTTTTNVLSANRPSNYMVRFRFKLNSTADTTNKILFNIITGQKYSDGYTYMSGRYSISGGNITVNGFCDDTTQLSMTATAVNTNWYYCDFFRFGDTSRFAIQVQNLSDRILYFSDKILGSTFDQGSAPSNKFSVGNNYLLTNQCYAIIDQFIVDEAIYAVSVASANRVKLRTHEILGNIVV